MHVVVEGSLLLNTHLISELSSITPAFSQADACHDSAFVSRNLIKFDFFLISLVGFTSQEALMKLVKANLEPVLLIRDCGTLSRPLHRWKTLSLAEFDVRAFHIFIFLRSVDVFKHGQIFPIDKIVGATSCSHIDLATALFSVTSLLNLSEKR